jgi:hypothetical protein
MSKKARHKKNKKAEAKVHRQMTEEVFSDL